MASRLWPSELDSQHVSRRRMSVGPHSSSNGAQGDEAPQVQRGLTNLERYELEVQQMNGSPPQGLTGEHDFISRNVLGVHDRSAQRVSRRSITEATTQQHSSRVFEPPPSESPHRCQSHIRPIDDEALLPKIAPPRVEEMRKNDAIAALSKAPTIVEKMWQEHVEQEAASYPAGGGGGGAGYSHHHPPIDQDLPWSGRKLIAPPSLVREYPESANPFLPGVGIHSSPEKPHGLRRKPESYETFLPEEMKLKETFRQDGKLSSNRLLFNPLTGEATSMVHASPPQQQYRQGLQQQQQLDPSPPKYSPRLSNAPPPVFQTPAGPRECVHIWSHRFSAALPIAPTDGTKIFTNPLTGETLEMHEGKTNTVYNPSNSTAPSSSIRTFHGTSGPSNTGYAPFGRHDQPVSAVQQPFSTYGPV